MAEAMVWNPTVTQEINPPTSRHKKGFLAQLNEANKKAEVRETEEEQRKRIKETERKRLEERKTLQLQPHTPNYPPPPLRPQSPIRKPPAATTTVKAPAVFEYQPNNAGFPNFMQVDIGPNSYNPMDITNPGEGARQVLQQREADARDAALAIQQQAINKERELVRKRDAERQAIEQQLREQQRVRLQEKAKAIQQQEILTKQKADALEARKKQLEGQRAAKAQEELLARQQRMAQERLRTAAALPVAAVQRQAPPGAVVRQTIRQKVAADRKEEVKEEVKEEEKEDSAVLKETDIKGPPPGQPFKSGNAMYDRVGPIYLNPAELRKFGLEPSPDDIVKPNPPSGTSGSTFMACTDANNCERIVKIGMVEEGEVFRNWKAGMRNLAPKIYPPILRSPIYVTDPKQKPPTLPYSEHIVKKLAPGKLYNDSIEILCMQRMSRNLEQVLYGIPPGHQLKRNEHTNMVTNANPGEFTSADADAIVALFDQFFDANFMHLDMKTDNIMCEWPETPGKPRVWRIIDFGTSWYGGDHYKEDGYPLGFENCPYGYDVKTKKQIPYDAVDQGWLNARTLHFNIGGGWPGAQPPEPARDWDLACLVWSIYIYVRNRQTEKNSIEYLYDLLRNRGNVIMKGLQPKIKGNAPVPADYRTQQYWEVKLPSGGTMQCPGNAVKI